MVKAYTVTIMDKPEQAEQAARLLDKVFRWRYNVHGVKRLESAYNRKTGELSITVALVANWYDSPRMIYLFPEYTPEGIFRTWCRYMARFHELDDSYISELHEEEGK